MSGAGSEVSFRYDDTARGRGDLTLRLGDTEHVGDSYYFALDGAVLPNDSGPIKVRAVLRRVIEQWIVAIERLQPSGEVYLAFGFFDQGTQWLCCRRQGRSSDVSVVAGWSDVEGVSIYPSEPGDPRVRPAGWRTTGDAALTLPRDDLLEALRRSLPA